MGVGIGNIFSTLVASIARNPAARDQVFGIGMLGFALTEAVALFALLIAFIILFAWAPSAPEGALARGASAPRRTLARIYEDVDHARHIRGLGGALGRPWL